LLLSNCPTHRREEAPTDGSRWRQMQKEPSLQSTHLFLSSRLLSTSLASPAAGMSLQHCLNKKKSWFYKEPGETR
jgi:hypothetical protein